MSNRLTILITGASGLVGSRIAQILSRDFHVLTPRRDVLDVSDADGVAAYMKQNKPSVVIHAAAFTDVVVAEKEREVCWKVNVEGTRNIAYAAKKIGAFLIFISTGSVFSGTRDNPGPFTEDDEPAAKPSKLSWYGWTKRCAEKEVNGAVVRISHPVKKEGRRVERDYIHKLLNLYQKGRLYALFTDQFFPITWIDDLAEVVEKLIESPRRGVFHVASPDLTSPYELIKYIVKTTKLRGDLKNAVRKALMEEFLKTADQPLRFTQFCAIDCQKTQKLFRVRFQSWKAINDSLDIWI